MTTRLSALVICALLIATPGLAQAPEGSSSSTGPVSLGVLGGFAAGGDDTGATIGGTINFDLNRRLSIEGRGLFLDRGRQEHAVEATANLIVRLAADRMVVPYAAVGGGIYHAMYDFDDWPRFDMMDQDEWSRMMGTLGNRFGRDPWFGNWMGRLPMGPGQGWSDFVDEMRMQRGESDTEPAFSFGGGVDIAVTPSLFVRPDFRGLMIFAGDTYTIGSVTFSLGYRF